MKDSPKLREFKDQNANMNKIGEIKNLNLITKKKSIEFSPPINSNILVSNIKNRQQILHSVNSI